MGCSQGRPQSIEITLERRDPGALVALPADCAWRLSPCAVDRGEKLGHFGGVKRTSAWVTLWPTAG